MSNKIRIVEAANLKNTSTTYWPKDVIVFTLQMNGYLIYNRERLLSAHRNRQNMEGEKCEATQNLSKDFYQGLRSATGPAVQLRNFSPGFK